MKHLFTNKLVEEKSLYLLQHAHNPVHWFPWGKEALELANNQNKPLIISIGYSSCHWCHVMENESFTDLETAEIMNNHFVCIKIDREERPDLDHYYMDFVQTLIGRGGWPLNVFALPDGQPFYGGTYFINGDWKSLCLKVSELFANERDQILEYVNNAQSSMLSVQFKPDPTQNTLPNQNDIREAFGNLVQYLDFQKGGLRGHNKFPMPVLLEFLLNYSIRFHDKQSADFLNLTLEKIYKGGIYDQIGGGFSRYSTDPDWQIPHFEKMLYDNAQLISLYSKAYQVFGNQDYKKVVYETISFVRSELLSKNGGYFSALDADSEGEEGKYYVWNINEIESELGTAAQLIIDHFGLKREGNWDGVNVLHQQMSTSELAEKHKIEVSEVEIILADLKNKIYQKRQQRIEPSTDDKIVCSWNAMMLVALADAFSAFGDETFLDYAKESYTHFESQFLSDEKLIRIAETSKEAFLEDHAWTIRALISLYEIIFDFEILAKASVLMEATISNYYDHNLGMFSFNTLTDHSVSIRKIETSDNVIPSSNAVMADNLLRLGKLTNQSHYLNVFNKMLVQLKTDSVQNPAFHAHWLYLFLINSGTFYQIAITGDKAIDYAKMLNSYYFPSKVVAASRAEATELSLLHNRYIAHQTMIYFCEDNSCQLPIKSLEEMIIKMKKIQAHHY